MDAQIVKVYAVRDGWRLAKEVDVYRILASHGVGPIPQILHAEPDQDRFGFAFVVMSLLPGLDAVQISRLYGQMGAALAAIHRIGQDAYGYRIAQILDPQPDNTAYMTRQFARKLREFGDRGGDLALRDMIEAHVARRTALFANCAAPVLCHNDLHEANVLVTRAGATWNVTGFVDVENAVAADPLLDPAKRAGFLNGYGPLPPDWAERLSVYRLYHALELWDWFALTGNSAPLDSIAGDMRDLVDAGR